MEFLAKLKKIAQNKNTSIVLPESKDDRILKAASIILQENIAKIILLGDPQVIEKQAKSLALDISKASILDPRTDPNTDKYIQGYYEKRKHKGMTKEKARDILLNKPLFYGAMMVEAGAADGMVGGSLSPTAHTFRAAAHCVGMKKNATLISSLLILILPNNKDIGEQGMFFVADVALVPHPSAEQLSEIALETAKAFRNYTEMEPKVALLSFSTKGSSQDQAVMEIRRALKITRAKEPKLIIDGEVQVDTALVPDVAKRKDPEGIIAGEANILIFPNLEAANIAYKLVERTAQAKAIGPIFNGVKKPINDLSRGSTIEDIIGTVIITVFQA